MQDKMGELPNASTGASTRGRHSAHRGEISQELHRNVIAHATL
jgi:hypothetical protein